MFGPLGAMEILFILVLALLIFGPRRLPEVGRTIGKALGEFRRATTDLKRTVNTELALEEEEERPSTRRRISPPRSAGGEATDHAAAAVVRPAAGAHPRSPRPDPAIEGSGDAEREEATGEPVVTGRAAGAEGDGEDGSRSAAATGRGGDGA